MANPADVNVLHSEQAPEPLWRTSVESEHDHEHPELATPRWPTRARVSEHEIKTTGESHSLIPFKQAIQDLVSNDTRRVAVSRPMNANHVHTRDTVLGALRPKP